MQHRRHDGREWYGPFDAAFDHAISWSARCIVRYELARRALLGVPLLLLVCGIPSLKRAEPCLGVDSGFLSSPNNIFRLRAADWRAHPLHRTPRLYGRDPGQGGVQRSARVDRGGGTALVGPAPRDSLAELPRSGHLGNRGDRGRYILNPCDGGGGVSQAGCSRFDSGVAPMLTRVVLRRNRMYTVSEDIVGGEVGSDAAGPAGPWLCWGRGSAVEWA